MTGFPPKKGRYFTELLYLEINKGYAPKDTYPKKCQLSTINYQLYTVNCRHALSSAPNLESSFSTLLTAESACSSVRVPS